MAPPEATGDGPGAALTVQQQEAYLFQRMPKHQQQEQGAGERAGQRVVLQQARQTAADRRVQGNARDHAAGGWHDEAALRVRALLAADAAWGRPRPAAGGALRQLRPELAAWAWELGSALELSSESVHMAMVIVDHQCTRMRVIRPNLQMSLVAAVRIATRAADENVPSAEQLSEMTAGTYSPRLILATEEKIRAVLALTDAVKPALAPPLGGEGAEGNPARARLPPHALEALDALSEYAGVTADRRAEETARRVLNQALCVSDLAMNIPTTELAAAALLCAESADARAVTSANLASALGLPAARLHAMCERVGDAASMMPPVKDRHISPRSPIGSLYLFDGDSDDGCREREC